MSKIKGIIFLVICLLNVVSCKEKEQEKKTEFSSSEQVYTQEQMNDVFVEKDKEAVNHEAYSAQAESAYSTAAETKVIEQTIDLSTQKEMLQKGDTVTPLTLTIVSEEENGIEEAEEWYVQENLSLPMIGNQWDHFYDEEYTYQWIGEQLEISQKETGECLYVLTYPTDRWYINGNNACLKEGIFYGASVMNGYAQPDTCFLFAYDLEQDKLLWRSASQSCNSMNFIVKDEIILCGYGFTNEKDYLYQINRNTGEIIDRLALKSMPNLLVEQGDKLYVHTYSYNYIIDCQ